MQANRTAKPTVLVVDDERAAADTHARWLGDEYLIDVAYGGMAALDYLREFPVDVVVLPRRLADLSGDQVMVTVRDWGHDVRVVLVTADRPSFDVLGLGFDGYLPKPTGPEELRATVSRLVASQTYDSLWQELSQLRVCRNVLQAECPAADLGTNEHYRALLARIELLEAREADYRASVERVAASSAARV